MGALSVTLGPPLKPGAIADLEAFYTQARAAPVDSALTGFLAAFYVDACAPGPPYRTYWIPVVSLHVPYRP